VWSYADEILCISNFYVHFSRQYYSRCPFTVFRNWICKSVRKQNFLKRFSRSGNVIVIFFFFFLSFFLQIVKMGLRMTASDERIIYVYFFFPPFFLYLSIVPFCSLKPNLIKVVCQFCFLKGRKPHSCPLIKILFQYTRYICIPPYAINPKTLDSIIPGLFPFYVGTTPFHVNSMRLFA